MDRSKVVSAGLLKCINEPGSNRNSQSEAYCGENSPLCHLRGRTRAAKDALSRMPGLPCESCKSTQRPVRLWLDTPQPD
jgi:hypothetical protein